MYQFISVLVTCRCWWGSFRDTDVISTPHSGQVASIFRCYQYVAPSPVLIWLNASYDIPDMIYPGWQFIFFELATLSARPIRRNSPMRKFRIPCTHSRSWDPIISLSTYNTPKLQPVVCPSLSWNTAPYYTISKSYCLTTLSTDTLKSVGDSNPLLVVLWVARNWGAWYRICLVTTSWFFQKSARMSHIFEPAPYPSKFCRRCPRYNMPHSFLSFNNTRKKGYWPMLSISWTILISMMAAPIPCHLWNPCKTSLNCTAVLTQVSMMASMTFHSTLISQIPQVSVFTFGINTKIFQLIYVGRVMCSHMYCTSTTSFSQWAGLGRSISLSG